MKKRLAICDRDERYLQSMQNYLMKRLTQFEVITFATLQEASDYSKKQAFAICLLSESLYEKDLYGMQALEILILKENGKKEITEYPYMEKYQSMERLIQELLNEYAEHSLMDVPVYQCIKNVTVHAFYTPMVSKEQTSAALTLGQILSEEKRKVLYLNLQAFAGYEEFIAENNMSDITDLLYVAERQDINFGFRIQSMKQRIGGLDYFAPAQDAMDLLSVTQTEWKVLIDKVIETGEYTDIILDLSELCQGLYYFLQTSDCVYSMCAKTKEEQLVIDQYKKRLHKRQINTVLEKTKWMEFAKEWGGHIGNIERLTIAPLGKYMKGLIDKDGN